MMHKNSSAIHFNRFLEVTGDGDKQRCFDCGCNWGGKFGKFVTFATCAGLGDTRRGHLLLQRVCDSFLLDAESMPNTLLYLLYICHGICTYVMVVSKCLKANDQ